MKVEVGGTYETEHHIVFVVVGECTAKTVRFKKEEPGWRVLVMMCDSRSDVVPGTVYEWVKGAHLFTSLKRLS